MPSGDVREQHFPVLARPAVDDQRAILQFPSPQHHAYVRHTRVGTRKQHHGAPQGVIERARRVNHPHNVGFQKPRAAGLIQRQTRRARSLHGGIGVIQRRELPARWQGQVGIHRSLHQHGAYPGPGMAVGNPSLVGQRHLAVIYVHGGAALMPAAFRTKHGRSAPGLPVIVAARDEEPPRVPHHVEGLPCLEEDLVHHGDAGRCLPPVGAAVVGEEDADLIAGLVVPEIGPGAIQGAGARPAIIHRHNIAPVKTLHDRGGLEIDAVRAGRDGDHRLIGHQMRLSAAAGLQGKHRSGRQ